jgi:hypothetical protein
MSIMIRLLQMRNDNKVQEFTNLICGLENSYLVTHLVVINHIIDQQPSSTLNQENSLMFFGL